MHVAYTMYTCIALDVYVYNVYYSIISKIISVKDYPTAMKFNH